ncbi:unknown [Clostridium sp. CAG:1013]|nr:unknown [Clostridium sp. CAG:1013]
MEGDALGFGVFPHEAHGGFIRHRTDGASLEHVLPTEQHFRVAVGAALILAGEVQVNIGDLVAVEAQEGLKGDGVAVPIHGGAAFGAILGRQVETGIDGAVSKELAMLALGTHIVGRQGVNLGDTRHTCHQRGTHRSTGAHQVTVSLGIRHQLLGGHVQHGEAVLHNGVQFLVQTLLHDLRQGVAVFFLGTLPSDGHQLLLGAFDEGWEVAHRHRADVVDHIGDLVRVGHHHLEGLFFPQVLKLFEHLGGSAHVQGRLLIRVVEAPAAHDDPAVVRVLGVLEVDVAGSHHRLTQLLADLHDGAVVFPQAFHVRVPVADHEHVVPQGLDLQIVVVGGDLAQIFEGLSLHHGPEQLPRLTGTAHQQALTVLV